MLHHADLIGKGVGAVSGFILGLLSWKAVTDTAVLTFVASVIAGTTGFFVTMALQKIFKKTIEVKNTKP